MKLIFPKEDDGIFERIKVTKTTIRILIFITLLSCSRSKCIIKNTDAIYPRMIGDIDAKLEDGGFIICHSNDSITQYYRFHNNTKPYPNEKNDLVRLFKKEYNSSLAKKESGWIRIRFIINCKGESGRFRMIQSDNNYKEKTFDSTITNQLLNITKSISGWKVFEKDRKPTDYYFYLIFKIENGQIKEILP